MRQYQDYRPTGFDRAGAFLSEQQNWLVAPCGRNRDSDALQRSNCECFLKALGGESETVQVHRFGHWACGWFEIIIIDPADKEKIKLAEQIESKLQDYPVIDDEHFSHVEMEEANEVWQSCFHVKERIEYVRKHRSQFCFQDFSDLIGCIRGKYFAGYASELLS